VLIDWQASKEEWVAEVRARLVPRLMSDGRFASSGKLVARFEEAVERWQGGVKFVNLSTMQMNSPPPQPCWKSLSRPTG